MSNLTRLQAVSSSLDTAIDKAENLPDASGGGASIETCSCSFSIDAPALGDFTIHYTNASMQPATEVFDMMGTDIIVAKNTIITITPWSSMTNNNGDANVIIANMNVGAYIISGDASLIVSG